MNTNQLKKFAQTARTKLMQQVRSRLDYVLSQDTAELRGKAETLQKLRKELERIGADALVDKVAYTWFNRFVALRFMDANDFQPLRVAVVSPAEGSQTAQLLERVKSGSIPEELALNQEAIFDLLDGRQRSQNPENEVYRLLLVAACNQLSQFFPFLFERIDDYTELLLPEDLNSRFSILRDVVQGMSHEDCQHVEIIGWLYQFYISERKDEVFASKKAVAKEDIPAATQLFTPRWIVEYMVQNTLGKLWLQHKPQSGLRQHLPYYLDSPAGQNGPQLQVQRIEDITLLDQACGSGHILVYAFDLFAKLYEEAGYLPADIPGLILQHNLHGFEIDERAAQLASFALMMKARGYHRRFFREPVEPHILCFADLTLNELDLKELFEQLNLPLNEALLHDLRLLQQATNLGSLIQPRSQHQALQALYQQLPALLSSANIFHRHGITQLQQALKQLIALSEKYYCVVDNPPYMGSGKMNAELSKWVQEYYPKSKADLMVCFMERAQSQVVENGFVGMINLPSWMFLSSFEKYRKELNEVFNIDTLLHLGRGIFGSDFGTVAFTLIKRKGQKYEGVYRRLFEEHVQVRSVEKIRELFVDKNYGYYTALQSDFEKFEGNPIAYWVQHKIVEIFEQSKTLGEVAPARQGISTADNDRFLRFWPEVAISNSDLVHSSSTTTKWFKHNKGGTFRKWYGNLEFLINWSKNGDEIKNLRDIKGKVRSAVRNENYYFNPSVSWSDVTSGTNAFRVFPEGFIHNGCAPSAFHEDESFRNCLVAFGNLNFTSGIVKVINPTMHFSEGYFAKLPFTEKFWVEPVEKLSKSNIHISKLDWDARETSWDFRQQPLLQQGGETLEEAYDLYQQYWRNKFRELHRNEEELNRQFIEIYGLEEELSPEVPLEDITILKEETRIEGGELVFQGDKVMQQFVSYAVGCMFGRYALDAEGLILANQGETLEQYLQKVGKTEEQLRFAPDDDNILPVLDDTWFDDDIVARFHAFLKASFGAANFSKNLTFVEQQLGKDLRRYFSRDFYKDHVQRYKKRPIYWMFSSPAGHFRALVYLHRYTPDTLNTLLNGYLREFSEKLQLQRGQQERILVSGSAFEQSQARKAIDKIDAMLADCRQYETDILYPLASKRIPLHLDDGVLVNYNKFGRAVEEISGLNDKKAKDKVRKFDWIDNSLIQ